MTDKRIEELAREFRDHLPLATKMELVENLLSRQRQDFIEMLEGMRVSPIFYDQHGAPENEDDLVKNHILDQAIQKIKEIDGH